MLRLYCHKNARRRAGTAERAQRPRAGRGGQPGGRRRRARPRRQTPAGPHGRRPSCTSPPARSTQPGSCCAGPAPSGRTAAAARSSPHRRHRRPGPLPARRCAGPAGFGLDLSTGVPDPALLPPIPALHGLSPRADQLPRRAGAARAGRAAARAVAVPGRAPRGLRRRDGRDRPGRLGPAAPRRPRRGGESRASRRCSTCSRRWAYRSSASAPTPQGMLPGPARRRPRPRARPRSSCSRAPSTPPARRGHRSRAAPSPPCSRRHPEVYVVEDDSAGDLALGAARARSARTCPRQTVHVAQLLQVARPRPAAGRGQRPGHGARPDPGAAAARPGLDQPPAAAPAARPC